MYTVSCLRSGPAGQSEQSVPNNGVLEKSIGVEGEINEADTSVNATVSSPKQNRLPSITGIKHRLAATLSTGLCLATSQVTLTPGWSQH